MPSYNLDYIRNTLNPSAIPAGSDLIFARKADGSPAAYELSELATFFAGIGLSLPEPQSGARVFISNIQTGLTTVTHTGGIVPFSNALNDDGYFTSVGTFTMPSNVKGAEFVCNIRTTSSTPTVSLIRNGDIDNPVATAEGVGGYVSFNTGPVQVVASDYYQVTLENAGAIYKDLNVTNWDVRAVEGFA